MSASISRKTYTWVWLALLALLFATWGISRLDLKPFNLAIALAIAIVKMLLIILFFMHARYSERLVWVVAGAGFVWLIIFLDLTLSDYLTRGYSWSQ
jgi:cytochrome c oxidase subunit 4